jgi:hypothetical protein
MEKNWTHKKSVFWNRKGFALISSLMIMMLLMLVALAMLSLSSSSVSSAKVGKGISEAKANARMALMLAIGELQEQMGPDQRISANGAIVSQTDVLHPHWTGVWDSWKAGTDTNSQHSTIGDSSEMAPTYETNRRDYFRGWLLSLNSGDLDTDNALNVTLPMSLALDGKLSPAIDETAIRLVGEGSLGSGATPEKDYVSARLLSVNDPTDPSKIMGRYGWWIGDESQKARLLSDSYQNGTLTTAKKIFRSQAPASMSNTTAPGLESITNEQEINKLPSLKTLDLIGLDTPPADNAPKVSQLNFHSSTIHSNGVLADVREGGLKRDLNTLLERPIDVNDSGDEFMLYKFNGAEEQVPIQDLAAFYQLYRDTASFSTGGRGGIKYTASGSIQAEVPDYGASDNEYLREYTALYRNPLPVKVQFVLGVGASLITPAEKIAAGATLRPDDEYKLSLGVKPVISLWNPNNVPLVMNTNASQIMQVGFPPFVIRWKKYRAAGAPFFSNFVNLNYAITNESTGDGRSRSLDPYIIKVQFAKSNPIVFEPGEIKTFTVDIPEANWLENDGVASFGNRSLYEAKEFSSDGFYVTAKVAPPKSPDVLKLEGGNYQGFRMVFAKGDKITFAAYPELDGVRSRLVASANEIRGGGLQFFMKNKDANNRHRNYQFISRFGQDGGGPNSQTTTVFNADMIMAGFPDGEVIPFESELNAMPGAVGESSIKSFTDAGTARGLLMFTMMPGAELNNRNTAGFSAGRRNSTRPFLHGSTLNAPQIADNSPAGLYDYGWEWQVEKINDTEEVLQDDGNNRGYYGGGYGFGSGTTHVVQQYLPVLPPISIASLSSAHLGGYSLANNPVVTGNIKDAELLGDYRQTTATGQGGLAPQTIQAIGNSYAHPNIQPNQAFKTSTRELNTDVPLSDQEATYVDHSYLVNKALWDDFFFSSIAPQFTNVELQDAGEDKTAIDVAQDFLFSDTSLTLPNRRIVPYTANLSSGQFGLLESQYDDFSDGFADKIAAHLMIKGPFNVNSTSEEAWKVLLTSMRDKEVAYLDGNSGDLADEPFTPSGETPVGPGMLPNNKPILSGNITSDPADPLNQWTSWRSLSDGEIDQLAKAIVYQVKQRGPFLSLSEFINRRLDGTNRDLAVKGALQAAIDFEGNEDIPEVTINAEFRTDARKLDAELIKRDGAGDIIYDMRDEVEFGEALEGPIAYGSTPYVDQADILRQLGSILTPRGDTFVIRTYGDSLDANDKVIARAWCEAIVQRTPDYMDLSPDENHFAQDRLDSETNKTFGRKFIIISFRWLSDKEI